MNLELTDEQRQFAESVRRFSVVHLAQNALHRAHEPGFPFDVARLMAEHGLLGITIPELDGGQGGTLMDATLAIEQVALVCPRSADVVQAGNFGPVRTFAKFANAEQKSRWLPDILAGKSVISLAMTEPEAGSAVTDLRTTARADGAEYVINGTKIFATHSPDAKLFLVYVRFKSGVDGIGSVIVERDTPGLQIGKSSSLMGGEQWSQLYFDNCRIPAENVLLGAGGFTKQMGGFNAERIGNATRSLALGRYAFNAAKEYATNRRQFGKLLCEFQGLQWSFAEMAVKLEGSQLLLYRAAANANHGFPSPYETAIAKASCNQTGFDVANAALQVMGGLGYSQENLVEYCVRRTRGWMIAGGSIEILKNRIAESIFERRFSQRASREQAAE